ncbi:MAG: prolipoprotein diacylglyceryl transferase [Chloroflexi bacterium]|nr:prolipoprotein diacylglyceryl transferase [Chloroflexota bacterium]
MNGIIINIDPVIWRLGHFELRWYSVFVILAVVAAVLVSVRQFKRQGIPPGEAYSLAPWVLVGGVIGARLFHVMDQWQYYASHPLQILAFQQGGLAIWGALAGGGIATVAYSWLRHLSLSRLVDALVPGLLAAQITGRFACIINGDAYGGITSLPWAFIYVNPNSMIPAHLFGQPTHPYPVYEILWNAFSLLLLLGLRRRFHKDGLFFLAYLSLYSLGRFALTFVREENMAWGLQQAQVIALVTFIISLIATVRYARVKRASEGLDRG